MKNRLQGIMKILLQQKGIDLSKYEGLFLEKIIQRRILETKSISEEAYYLLLEQNSGETEQLIENLAVSYSEFFRNSLTFSVLEKNLLPTLVLSKKEVKNQVIRIWSVACAAGQEAYSLAMLLCENLLGTADNVSFRIFATDYSPEQIQLAQTGMYQRVGLGNVNLNRLSRWFTKQGNLYAIKNELKENIDFSLFDLLDNGFSSPPASIFGDFDIVLCANLLFYYSDESKEYIINKANRSLAKNGFLITSETEREFFIKSGFQEVFPQSAIFMKKRAEY